MGCSKTEKEVKYSYPIVVFVSDERVWVKAQYVPFIDEFLDLDYAFVMNVTGWFDPRTLKS